MSPVCYIWTTRFRIQICRIGGNSGAWLIAIRWHSGRHTSLPFSTKSFHHLSSNWSSLQRWKFCFPLIAHRPMKSVSLPGFPVFCSPHIHHVPPDNLPSRSQFSVEWRCRWIVLKEQLKNLAANWSYSIILFSSGGIWGGRGEVSMIFVMCQSVTTKSAIQCLLSDVVFTLLFSLFFQYIPHPHPFFFKHWFSTNLQWWWWSECIGEGNVADSGYISCCLSTTVGMIMAVL